MLLNLVRRSFNCHDVLVLGNDTLIPRNTSDASVGRIATRILDELIAPFRELNIDDTELACLKTIIFFDPG